MPTWTEAERIPAVDAFFLPDGSLGQKNIVPAKRMTVELRTVTQLRIDSSQ